MSAEWIEDELRDIFPGAAISSPVTAGPMRFIKAEGKAGRFVATLVKFEIGDLVALSLPGGIVTPPKASVEDAVPCLRSLAAEKIDELMGLIKFLDSAQGVW